MPATDDDTLLPFSLPGICQKRVTAAFDGGLISSDGGVRRAVSDMLDLRAGAAIRREVVPAALDRLAAGYEPEEVIGIWLPDTRT
jgi:hypothetical protein